MPHSSKIPVLIVEDDANVRFLMEAAARRSGLFHPVTCANDGQAALDWLHTLETCDLPALIVSDLSMPRMTGLELLRALKADDRLRHIPVAIITSSDLPNDRVLAMTAGACSFLPKPYGVESLVQALTGIREACGEAAGAAKSG